MPQYPAYYGHSFQPMPPQYAGSYGQGYGGYGQANPQSLQMILAYLLAQQQEQPQGQEQPMGEPTNPYLGQPLRPMPTGLSPLGRFNDMALRQSANLANRLEEGKQAVSEGKERQRLVDSITHPPPTAPYSISRPAMDAGPTPNAAMAPAFLNSRYGTGSVTFAPPGNVPRGTFGPDNLPFGQIGDPHPLAGTDPEQTTYQQQMIMDSIHKALGRKK